MKYGYLAMVVSLLGALVIIASGWPAAAESKAVAAFLGLLGSVWLLSSALMAAGVRQSIYVYLISSFVFLQWRFLYTHSDEGIYEWLFWSVTATTIFFVSSIVAVKWWRSLSQASSKA